VHDGDSFYGERRASAGSGDKPPRDRAEQRGDTIMKRSDPSFSQSQAMMYY
jgi:hypothetical protein